MLTPPDWVCPCCARTKAWVCRLDGSGRLFGHLVAHHDHIADHVERRFHETAAQRQWPGLDRNAKKFAMRMVILVSAFDETLICSDCNEADPKGKQAAGAPMGEFSFASADIHRFIRSAPNRSHEIDDAAAASVWQEQRESFERRLKAVDWIIGIALQGGHWYRPSALGSRPHEIEEAAWIKMLTQFSTTDGCRYPDLEVYVASTAVRPVNGATERTWRNHESRHLEAAPSDKEITAIAGLSRDWGKVSYDWACPCCGRYKAAIIQPSGQKRMSFVLAMRRAGGNGNVGPELHVCNECAWTQSVIAREAGVMPGFVGFADVRDAILPVQNGAHRIRAHAEVDKVVACVRERVAQLGDPRAYR